MTTYYIKVQVLERKDGEELESASMIYSHTSPIDELVGVPVTKDNTAIKFARMLAYLITGFKHVFLEDK